MPSTPIGYTKNLGVSKYAQGANPGNTALNNNYDLLDYTASGLYYPELEGAVGDGMTNDATALSDALAASIGKRLVLSAATYKVTSKISIDLDGGDIELVSYSNSKLYLTNTTSDSTMTVREGNIILSNGGNVTVRGVKFEGIRRDGGGNFLPPLLTLGDGGSSLSNLVIKNCKNVVLDNVTSTEAVYASIFIEDCESVNVVNGCRIEYNTYGGIEIIRTGLIYAVGNSFSYNGSTSGLTGYGISCSHRYGAAVDNTSIHIAGNKAWYNQRKCIDIHGGIGGKIIGNDVKGFTISGIGAVNEAGSDPLWPGPGDAPIDPLWAKRVTDLWICNNRIEQDKAWYDSVNTANSCDGIQVGSFATTALGGGSIFIHDNLLKNCNVSNQRAPIFVFVNIGGERMEAISIKDNTILDVQLGNTYKDNDGVIYLNEGTVIPKFVDLSGNKIVAKSGVTLLNGIKINCMNSGLTQKIMVDINSNKFYGDFTNPIYANRELEGFKAYKNQLNDDLLPDMIDQFNGSLDTALFTGNSSASKNLLRVNANEFPDGAMQFDIEVIASGAFNAFYGRYKFFGFAGNHDGTVSFSAPEIQDESGVLQNPKDFRPTFSWVATSETDVKILRINAPTNYTNYKIKINISSWRLQLFRTA
jgi:hypothetical protein